MAQPVVLSIQAKDEASKVIKGVAQAAVDAAKLLATATAALATEAVVAVKAANEQRAAEDKLAMSLAKTGQLTRENYDALVANAKAIAESTNATDEQVLALEALAINQGATVEQSKKIAAAAIDMAAALGEDATKSVKDLTKTLKGNAGELAETDSVIKRMTQSQLASGEAIDVIAAKYRGFAQSEAQTFAGAVDRVKKSFGELQERIGETVTENQMFVEVANATDEALKNVADIVKENQGVFVEFARDGIRFAFEAFDQFLEAVADSRLAFAFAKESMLEYVQLVLQKMAPILKAVFSDETVDGWLAGLDESLASTREQITAASEWRNVINEIRGEFQNVGSVIENAVSKPMQDSVDKAKELQEIVGGISAQSIEFVGPTATPQEMAANQAATDARLKAEAQAIKDAQTAALDSFAATVSAAVDIAGASAGGIISSLSTIIANILPKVVEDISSEMVAMIAKIGPIVGMIVDAISNFDVADFQGIVDALIKGFIMAMGNIGPLIAMLAANIDDIVQGLVFGIINGIASIVVNLPNIILGLMSAMVEALTQFGPRLRAAFSQLGPDMRQVFGEITADLKASFQSVVEGLVEPIKNALENIGEWFAGLGETIWRGISGALTWVGNAVMSALDAIFDFDEIKDDFNRFIVGGVRAIGDFIGQAGAAIGDFFKDYVGTPIANLAASIGDAFANMGRFIRDEIGGAIRDAGRAFGQFVDENILAPVERFLEGFANALIDALNFIIRGLNYLPYVDINEIPRLSYQTGGVTPGGPNDEVPATLHGSEVVVNPAGQARLLDAIAQGGLQGGNGSGVTVQVYERRESRGEMRQIVMDALDDLARARQIKDIRMGAPA